MGIYSLTRIFWSLYTTQSTETRKPPRVVSSIQKYRPTGVDEAANIILTFPRDGHSGGNLVGIATTSFRIPSDIDNKRASGPAVRSQSTKGELQVWSPIYRQTRISSFFLMGLSKDKHWSQPGPGPGSNRHNGYLDNTYPESEGYGMFWEADEETLAPTEGRKAGRYEVLDESTIVMDVMDEVRNQHDLHYPSNIKVTH
ncbi:dimeric dihydrodiol dehydrogenase [Penicillium argentinense]|uniref:Dimeric dihydrodiol dehydrogenase n=1 Tax=Penicillium argentinense TaxID=1131581 RepID=A0A9W9FDY9_9EURO|nr:dimeric dihydrodiol dehydrogenase [Penicillium argentinense]KAJ5098466.1 dimeric dihydrodiol dehydrogenase [Penicillium argentinense]